MRAGEEGGMAARMMPEVLAETEAGRRVHLLAELQAAFDELGVRCVLARRHRLVLWFDQSPCPPSGLLSPQLHIFSGRGDIATTDGEIYRLRSGGEYPAADPAAAAVSVLARCREQ